MGNVLIALLISFTLGTPNTFGSGELSQIAQRSKHEDYKWLNWFVEHATELNLDAPFFSQAPEGDWSQPWQDACEEASLIVAHYGMIEKEIDKATFKRLILEMVEWQNEHFGYYESTTVDQVVELYENFFENALQTKVINDPSVEGLKKELAQGHLIVAPFAGRMLGNPNYSGEGPYYHMMVIKGFSRSHFITNDVGTQHGEDFSYEYDVLLSALHDYQEPGIESTPGRVIVLSKK